MFKLAEKWLKLSQKIDKKLFVSKQHLKNKAFTQLKRIKVGLKVMCFASAGLSTSS